MPARICGGQALADSGFKVVAALVGRIDSAKAGVDGEFGEGCRAIFFPGGAVEKIRNGRLSVGHGLYCHMRRCRSRASSCC